MRYINVILSKTERARKFSIADPENFDYVRGYDELHITVN